MNKERRRAIDAILLNLAALQEAIEKIPDLSGIDCAIGSIAKEEGAKEAAKALERAYEAIDEVGTTLSDLGDRVADVIANLEVARDGG